MVKYVVCLYTGEILTETWIRRILSLAYGHCIKARDWSPYTGSHATTQLFRGSSVGGQLCLLEVKLPQTP